MSSFEEEERFVQLIHDFIESAEESEESSSPIYSASASSKCLFYLHQNHQPDYHITLQEILSETEETEYEMLESVKKHLRNRRDTQKSNRNLKKCLVNKLKMDGFNASLCQTSWSSSLGCPAGEYEYIAIISEAKRNDYQPIRLILDIDFKSQFELARPTPTYKELTNSLPNIFIGKAEKLNKIITLLCAAAKQSLKESGLHFPPWRTTTYMKAKWLSECQKSPASSNNNNITESTFGKNASKSLLDVGNISVVKKSKKRSDFGGGGSGCSGLSSQFSNMGINCC